MRELTDMELDAVVRQPFPKSISNQGMTRSAGAGVLRKAERAAGKPTTDKPPLPPDEARDRRIKALSTQVQNLRARIAWYTEQAAKRGIMTFTAMAAISKALHPEHEPSTADIEEEAATPLTFEQLKPRLIDLLTAMSSADRFDAFEDIAAAFDDIEFRGRFGTIDVPLFLAAQGAARQQRGGDPLDPLASPRRSHQALGAAP